MSDFLLDLHQSLAHQGFAKSLDISIGMPALFANLAASRSRHISSQKIAQLSYRKRLRYYLDFCFKYHHEKSKKESPSYFIKKLRDKNQTEQQQRQTFHAVSIFYGIKNIDQDEIGALKNKKENISTKKLV